MCEGRRRNAIRARASALAVRANTKARNLTRRLLATGRAILRVVVLGTATAAASLLTFVNAIQFVLGRSRRHSLPASQRRSQNSRTYFGGRRRARPQRTHRDYYIFLKYKIARRVPALFRFHHSVWAFRLRTYARRLSSTNLLRFSIYPFSLPDLGRLILRSREFRPPSIVLDGADLRRVLLRHGDRLGCLSQHPPIPLRYDRLPLQNGRTRRSATIAMVTPSYNQACYLKQAIRSVLDNGYPFLEYAVVDGGSRDETPLILERYGHRLAYWVSEPDGGQSHAIQKGFERVSGEIMGYLNSDDMLLPGALGLVADHFAAHPEVDVVYGHRILINDAGLEIGRWILPPHSNEATRRADYIPQETLFWRSELYRRIGGIDTSFRFAMDWDLILRFQAAGAIFHRLPYFLACFRVHESQKTHCIRESIGAAEVDLLRERELGKDRSAWSVREYDEKIKNRAVITELAHKCRYRSTRL